MSLDDQFALCRRLAASKGIDVSETYQDRAISGASILRPGYQQMLQDARAGQFDVLIAESIDRLSRDQEHIAALYKQLSFLGISVLTVAEGEVSELHIGLKGTMNALFLKDLGQKTRRGLEGRVRAGRSAGGITYGYDRLDTSEENKGLRKINKTEAAIVCRIFSEYANGKSPRAIAIDLNKEGISGPRGGQWGPSTIHGNVKRATGILNNELYIGRLIWNRQRFVKDPITGKRQARMNPSSEWITEDLPDLRIIDQDIWDRAKARQAGNHSPRPERTRRPKFLLSGLLKCGCCGHGYIIISHDTYGCARHRDRGTCTNGHKIKRESLERVVFELLQHELLSEEMIDEYLTAYRAEYNAQQMTRDSERQPLEAQLQKTTASIARLIKAIEDGLYSPSIKNQMEELEARKLDLERRLQAANKPTPRLHAASLDSYKREVINLASAVNDPDLRQEASEALRGLIDEIIISPDEDGVAVDIKGKLAAVMHLGTGWRNNNKAPLSDENEALLTLVAGVGFRSAWALPNAP